MAQIGAKVIKGFVTAKEKAEIIFYNEFSPALMIRFGSLSMEQGGVGVTTFFVKLRGFFGGIV